LEEWERREQKKKAKGPSTTKFSSRTWSRKGGIKRKKNWGASHGEGEEKKTIFVDKGRFSTRRRESGRKHEREWECVRASRKNRSHVRVVGIASGGNTVEQGVRRGGGQ